MQSRSDTLSLGKLSLTDVAAPVANGNNELHGNFPNILNSVSSLVTAKKDGDGMGDILDWLKDLMEYNVPNGTQFRAKLLMTAYLHLVPNASKGEIELARILGWICEIGQAASLVADDIMDNGVTRRGKPCWYRVDNKGTLAFNDVLLLEHVSYQLLRKHFGHMDVYVELLDLILGTVFKTVVGQSLDTQVEKLKGFDEYTPELYHSIVTYKTAYYTVFLPVATAMTLAGFSSRVLENHGIWKMVGEITLKIGELFQIQDDYLDCYGTESILGKVGTDIQEGKCTWLFVTAKGICSKDQYQQLKEHYGSDRADDICAVKILYETLGLPAKYKEYQDKVLAELRTDIKKIDHLQLAIILQAAIDNIYNRQF